MNSNKKKFKEKEFKDDFVRICPACGFSFRAYESDSTKKIKKCPMCGYKIREPDIFPHNQKEFNDKII
jgi:rubrerythrin